MLFLYELFVYLGYFLIMTIFMIVAILTAKKKTAWIWYAIGAVVQLLSLSGNQITANINETDMTMYWIIYFCLLIATAIIIVARYNKTTNNISTDAKGK